MDSDSSSSDSFHTLDDLEMEDPNSQINNVFNFVDWSSCPNIIRAVLRDDIPSVLQLLQHTSNGISMTDQLNNTPLHMAVLNKNVEMVDALLNYPDVDLEFKNFNGETPLMKSIGRSSDEIVIRLLNAGADVNTEDYVGRNPLHVALNFQRTIVEELIKKGANINLVCGCGVSPLFHAISTTDLELICMLLYYNADTTVKNYKITPFLYSLDYQFPDNIAYELFPFVVDFSVTDTAGFNCLLLSANNFHPIVMDILNVIDDNSMILNQVDNEGNSALFFSLFYDNAILFKKLFSRIDHRILLKCTTPFLETMILRSEMNKKDWVDCLYLLANSDIFEKLVLVLLDHIKGTHTQLFEMLLNQFKSPDISKSCREKIIYLFLSYGAPVHFEDIICYYFYFGPCQELNIFLRFEIIGEMPRITSPFLCYLLGQEERKSYENLKNDFLEEVNGSHKLVNIFRFFTLSVIPPQQCIKHNKSNDQDYITLQTRSEVPSLLELCRNELRFTIRDVFNITTTNKFYQTVERLNIHKKLIDFLLFRTPIKFYES